MRGNRASAVAICCYAVLIGLAGTTGGCGSKVKLEPKPVIYKGGRFDLAEMAPPSQRTRDLRVFYATNRVAKGPVDERDYTNGVYDGLRLGVANVSMGEKGDTWEEICNENPTFHVTSFQELARLKGPPATSRPAGAADPFVKAVSEQLAISPNKQVNIYVHGYRTDMEWECGVLAKLFHCSGRRGAMVCFAWPARQSLMLYGSDVKRARQSAPRLAELIELLAKESGAERINLLAYSCGATLVTEALAQLRVRYAHEDAEALSQRLRLGNVIFAASDIDLKTFARGQLSQIRDLADRVVIYIAANDGALGMASFGYGASRLGRPDLKELEVTQADLDSLTDDAELQVVDVTDVPGPHAVGGGFGGHGYWYANDWIMTDLLVAFRWQIPAEERGLVRRPGKARWYFPKDYPQRITAALRRRLDESTTSPATAAAAAAAPAPAHGREVAVMAGGTSPPATTQPEK
jgi:esterase/lipase superfamily enzyme